MAPEGSSNTTSAPTPAGVNHYQLDSSVSTFAELVDRLTRTSNGSMGHTGWDILTRHAAPNALLDSSARFDPPRCDEDTRIEVIRDIMGWIRIPEADTRILCLTGGAGSGKSAIQQTVAEKCQRENILAATFFFSASDPSRNVISKVITTIAYQLGLLHPDIQATIARSVEADPWVFNKSVHAQAEALITTPIRSIKARHLYDLPSVIFLDGLDECLDKDQQTELLVVLRNAMKEDRRHFRLFIACRPEWAIRGALDDDGHIYGFVEYIRLSDYDASGDIRRTLWKRIREIGLRSSDPRAWTPGWPSSTDLNQLVYSASGQYIYAMTVVRYLSQRRSSPVDRLKTVLSWTADGEQIESPLAALDLLYINILSRAREAYEAANLTSPGQFLNLLRAYTSKACHSGSPEAESQAGKVLGLQIMDRLLDFQEGTYEVILSNIRSLVTTRPLGEDLSAHVHHKYLCDFLETESRSRESYTPIHGVLGWLATRMLRNIVRAPHTTVKNAAAYASSHARLVWSWDGPHERVFLYSAIRVVLYSMAIPAWTDGSCLLDAWIQFTEEGGWEKIDAFLSSGRAEALNPGTESILDRVRTLWAGPPDQRTLPMTFKILRQRGVLPALLHTAAKEFRAKWVPARQQRRGPGP